MLFYHIQISKIASCFKLHFSGEREEEVQVSELETSTDLGLDEPSSSARVTGNKKKTTPALVPPSRTQKYRQRASNRKKNASSDDEEEEEEDDDDNCLDETDSDSTKEARSRMNASFTKSDEESEESPLEDDEETYDWQVRLIQQ